MCVAVAPGLDFDRPGDAHCKLLTFSMCEVYVHVSY